MTPLIICFPGSIPYESDKAVPLRYNATMLEDGKKLMIEATRSIENIEYVSGITRSGHMFAPAPLQKVDSVSANKKVHGKDPVVVNQEPVVIGPSNEPDKNEDVKEFLRLIRISDYKMVNQLL